MEPNLTEMAELRRLHDQIAALRERVAVLESQQRMRDPWQPRLPASPYYNCPPDLVQPSPPGVWNPDSGPKCAQPRPDYTFSRPLEEAARNAQTTKEPQS